MYVEKSDMGYNIIGMPEDVFKGVLTLLKQHVQNLPRVETKNKMNKLRKSMQNEIH